jgi:hypothetical protein
VHRRAWLSGSLLPKATGLPQLPLIGLILASLIALVPLAHSSPPDPTWLPGLWDNADQDDAVILATSFMSTVDAGWLGRIGYLPTVVGRVRDITRGNPAAALALSDPSRAPPAI